MEEKLVISKLRNSILEYLEDEEQDFEKIPFFGGYLNEDFLEYRKILLQNVKNTKQFNVILDPISSLQCMPSIDVALLEFDDNCKQFLKDQNIQPFQIKQQKEQQNISIDFTNYQDYFKNQLQQQNQNDKQLQIKQNIGLIGYHSNSGTIFAKNDKNTYSQTLKKQPKKALNIKLLLNESKSLQTGQIQDFTQYIINYQGTTACGSSGGPLINEFGEIIGINTGSFDDVTEKEDIITSKNVTLFDIPAFENSDSYKQSKNYNCAINVNHPIFKAWINQDINSVLYKENNNNQSSNTLKRKRVNKKKI